MDSVYRNALNTLAGAELLADQRHRGLRDQPKLTLRLNAYNLADEDYVDRVGGGHFVPGAGRVSAMLDRRREVLTPVLLPGPGRPDRRSRWREAREVLDAGRVGGRPGHRRPPVGAGQGQPAAPRGLAGGAPARAR